MESKPLTIVGRGFSWYYCPWEGEIWATATCLITPGMEDKHYDKVFAFDMMNYELDKALKVARERKIPIVSGRGYATERFPIEAIYKEFSTGYLKNSASYMLALAILRGYNPLALFGLDQTGIYAEGRPYVTFWLGVAFGRGIDYTTSHISLPHYLVPELQGAVDRLYHPFEYAEKYANRKLVRMGEQDNKLEEALSRAEESAGIGKLEDDPGVSQ